MSISAKKTITTGSDDSENSS